MKKLTAMAIFLASMASFALVTDNSSIELTCRAKAKDIAADTYRTCISENRAAEIDNLKKSYQERLRSLKEDYEKEIQKLGGKVKTSRNEKKLDSLLPKAEHTFVPDETRMDIPEPIPVESSVERF